MKRSQQTQLRYNSTSRTVLIHPPMTCQKLLPALCFDKPRLALIILTTLITRHQIPTLDNGVPVSPVCGHGCLVVNSQVLLAAVHDGLVNMGVQAAAG